jgi:hypothetical protein
MTVASRRVSLAAALATILLALACNQDKLTAPKNDLRVLTPPSRRSSSHPNNSPDLIVGEFQARNTANAKTSTDTTFGFRVKWYTKYRSPCMTGPIRSRTASDS